MADANDLAKEVWDGEAAARLWNDPILQKAFERANESIVAAIRNAKDEKQAYKAAIALQVFEVIQASLKSYIDTGKMAALELEQRKFSFWR